MYTSTLYNLSLNESAFEENKLIEFSSIFTKLDIYAKQRRYINEGYKNLPNDIIFNLNEQGLINEMLSYMEYKLLEQYLPESIMSQFVDSAKKAAKSIYGTITKANVGILNFVKGLAKLPAKIKTAILFIEKLIETGISKVSDFIKYIGKLLVNLGDTIKDAVMSFGIFNDSNFINNAPKLSEKFAKLEEGGDPKSNATFNYVLLFVVNKANDKSFKIAINEADNYQDATTKSLDQWALSHKDSWLEKSKNNTLFRLFLSGTNANGERLGFFRTLIISIIGSFICCTMIPLIASSFVSGTPLLLIAIACRALWILKNVARIIINRTLTYKQDFKYKDGVLKHNKLFDARTILSICIAFLTPALFWYFHDEIAEWVHSLFPHEQPPVEVLIAETNPEVIEEQLVPVEKTEVITRIVKEIKQPVEVKIDEPIPEIPAPDTPAVAVKLDDIEPLPTKIEGIRIVNDVNNIEPIPAPVEEYADFEDVPEEEIVNVYNNTTYIGGGFPSQTVILHDHGHVHDFNDQVMLSHGRIVHTDGHAHAVLFNQEHSGSHGHFGHGNSGHSEMNHGGNRGGSSVSHTSHRPSGFSSNSGGNRGGMSFSGSHRGPSMSSSSVGTHRPVGLHYSGGNRGGGFSRGSSFGGGRRR